MRPDNETWTCVMCGNPSKYDRVVCYECEFSEKNRQREQPGSITEKQLWKINHSIEKYSTEETDKMIRITIPDFDGDLEGLSTRQASALIAGIIEYVAENPAMCNSCREKPIQVWLFCQNCYDDLFHEGIPLTQCRAVKSDKMQCLNKGHFESGLCYVHRNYDKDKLPPADAWSYSEQELAAGKIAEEQEQE